MESAQDLIRSVARAFYPSEQILIIDALILHSAVRDDDLALLMGMQTKYLRKLCGKLKEDGMISVHSRAETREGSNRPFSRDYYFIDTHKTIDVIKYKLARMTRDVDAKYGQTEEEKKEYFCPQCKSEYTQMDVLDEVGPLGFTCRRCKHLLEVMSDDFGASHLGHEVQSRLNAQLMPFEKLLQIIDESDVPDNTIDEALRNALPVKRDATINPTAKSEPVTTTGLPPATVRGMVTEPEKVHVEMWDEEQKAEAAAAEIERKRLVAEQNALPEWHTTSTVTGDTYVSSQKPATSQTNGITSSMEESKKDFKSTQEEEGDKKQPATFDAQAVDDFYDQLARDDEEEEEDDSSEDDSDDEDEEDKTSPEESELAEDLPPQKKVKLEDPRVSKSQEKQPEAIDSAANGDSEEESEG